MVITVLQSLPTGILTGILVILVTKGATEAWSYRKRLFPKPVPAIKKPRPTRTDGTIIYQERLNAEARRARTS
jgi:hypothetical protein